MGTCHGAKLEKKTTFSSAKHQVRSLYDIERYPVGKGAFAQVFKGVLKTNKDIKVAIKVFLKDKLGDCNLKAIREEVKVLCKLDHPNIVKYYDVYEDSKNVFIVTEFIEGKTLSQELVDRKTHFAETTVAHIMSQLVSAIHHCHANNIAHRDIKPDNIIIDAKGNVTLIDFGLSKAYSKERNLRTKAGSPLFMAPEVDHDQKYSSKCDIWGLGVLLYILLSNNVPFSIKHYNRIVKGLEKCEPQFNTEIWEATSKSAKKLVQRMIVYDPIKRIGIEELADHKWFDIIRTDSTMSDDHSFTEGALHSLLEFEGIPLLKHSALRILVNLIPSSKLKEFYNEFAKLDEDNDGMLSFKDLKRSFKAFDPKIKNKQIQSIVDKLDYFANGKIHYTDYLVARIQQSEFIDMKLVESVFKTFDSDCDGKVDKDEIRKELSKMLKF